MLVQASSIGLIVAALLGSWRGTLVSLIALSAAIFFG